MGSLATKLTSLLYRQVQGVRFPFRWKKRSYALRPTRYGIIFLLMLMALLIGSMNHNSNFGYLLTFFLGGVVLVSLVHTFSNLQDISLAQVPVTPVFAGDTANISFLLTTKKPLKRGLTVRLDHFSCESTDLFDTSATIVKIPIPTCERGVLQKESVTLSTDFPLGLIEMQTTLRVSVSCMVYPEPVPSAFITDEVSGTNGDRTAGSFAGETDFSELSPYRLGDEIRRIHWKSLAAGKDLHTVKYEESHMGGTTFSLSRLPFENVEKKLGRLCYMILMAESQGMKYGLVLGDLNFTEARGNAHKNACLKALALY
jgi:uncharacterized protein (DUF58 family)